MSVVPAVARRSNNASQDSSKSITKQVRAFVAGARPESAKTLSGDPIIVPCQVNLWPNFPFFCCSGGYWSI